LLFVCTGNLCRSPLAERRTRHLGAAGGLTVQSAGTRAVVGAPMDEDAAQVLAELGGDPEGHRAAQLTEDDVAAADLVLTMAAAHRTAVLERSPGALRTTFTLAEAVGLLDLLDPGEDPIGLAPAEHLRAMVARLAAGRALLPRPHAGFPDVPDPIGRPLAVHREAGRLIDEALRALLPRLLPAA
jgi:protein-tyrosine phosphatase